MKELKDLVFERLEREIDGFGRTDKHSGRVGEDGPRVSVRKNDHCDAAGQYWFDAMDSVLGRVGYAVYTCGSQHRVYVFPSGDLADMLAGAHRAEKTGALNFDIHPGRHRLKPNGIDTEHDISQYFDALSLIGPLPDNLLRLTIPSGPTGDRHLKIEASKVLRKAVRDHHYTSKCERCEAVPYEPEAHLLRDLVPFTAGDRFLLDLDTLPLKTEVEILCPSCHRALHEEAGDLDPPTVGQPVAFNRFGWTRPEFRHEAGAPWVADYGFAAEDWNFALDQAVHGYVYGYGQGALAPDRVKRAGGRFDVFFYYRQPDGVFRAAGVFRNAEYLDEGAAAEAWTELKMAGVVQRRLAQLRTAFGPHKEAVKRAAAAFLADRPVRWKVQATHVQVFTHQPRFSPKRSGDHRHGTAYDWSDYPWTLLPLMRAAADDYEGEIETVEGRRAYRTHVSAERSHDFMSKVKAQRQALLDAGKHLSCEWCGFDFAARYDDPRLENLVEGHHTRPVSRLGKGGGRVKASEIALLCPNCHRAAHRTGLLNTAEFQLILRG